MSERFTLFGFNHKGAIKILIPDAFHTHFKIEQFCVVHVMNGNCSSYVLWLYQRITSVCNSGFFSMCVGPLIKIWIEFLSTFGRQTNFLGGNSQHLFWLKINFMGLVPLDLKKSHGYFFAWWKLHEKTIRFKSHTKLCQFNPTYRNWRSVKFGYNQFTCYWQFFKYCMVNGGAIFCAFVQLFTWW